MKRALRIILPLVLILVILGCTAWYFLIYDPGFTQELLLQQARRQEDLGHYKVSTFLYDVAYFQSNQDDNVAIELANQYLSTGNYTKAEYTISQAIRTNPSADLYTALCDLYVQQDKLLDAVQLLSSIPDAAISSELEAQRPEAPKMTPDPGFYTQYISVSITAPNAKLYVSTDGDYPSVLTDGYTEAFTLSTGETVVCAIAVGENGLVSPMSVCGYTVGGVIEVVEFQDAAMEAAIRAAIGAREAEVLYTDRLWDVTEFTVPAEAKSFADLAVLPYLEKLTITEGSEGDLAVLSELAYLQELAVYKHKLTDADLELIAAHTGLTTLALPGCSLSGIAPLAPLTQLTQLDLSANTLRNISAISGMTKLTQLNLNGNVVTDLSALSSLSALTHLDIAYNAVSKLDPLLGNTGNLTNLNADHNQITDLTGISKLEKLQVLTLSHNMLTDVSPLSMATGLVELDISNNAVTDITSFSTLTQLQSLKAAYNTIPELPTLPADCHLVTLDVSHNVLLDLLPLEGLGWLNTVNVDYNPDLELLDPLDKCPVLIAVNAYGTKVTEVSFLTDKSIIVNFNPVLDETDTTEPE